MLPREDLALGCANIVSVKKTELILLYLSMRSLVLICLDRILSELCLASCVFWSSAPWVSSSLIIHNFDSLVASAPLDLEASTALMTELNLKLMIKISQVLLMIRLGRFGLEISNIYLEMMLRYQLWHQI